MLRSKSVQTTLVLLRHSSSLWSTFSAHNVIVMILSQYFHSISTTGTVKNLQNWHFHTEALIRRTHKQKLRFKHIRYRPCPLVVFFVKKFHLDDLRSSEGAEQLDCVVVTGNLGLHTNSSIHLLHRWSFSLLGEKMYSVLSNNCSQLLLRPAVVVVKNFQNCSLQGSKSPERTSKWQ